MKIGALPRVAVVPAAAPPPPYGGSGPKRIPPGFGLRGTFHCGIANRGKGFSRAGAAAVQVQAAQQPQSAQPHHAVQLPGEGAATSLEPRRGGPAGPGPHLWAAGGFRC